MGKARRFLPVLMAFFLFQRAAIGQQPLHWEATIESAKATASQSNRLVLVLFSAPWCTACHHLENDIRDQPGAAAALEAGFVPVKINYDYYPNTAKQYGVTRLPTTVILAPNAQGEVLAVIPERMPVDEYLSKLNKISVSMKQRQAGVFAQIQASPTVGNPAEIGHPSAASPFTAPGSSPFANPNAANQAASMPRLPSGQTQNSTLPGIPPVAREPSSASQAAIVPAANNGAGGPMVAMVAGPGSPASRPFDPQKHAESIKPPANPLFGLDGFCPVSLLENSRWQPGRKAFWASHRGRTYLFVGAEERSRFQADPDRYAPVSSGDDVVLLLERGRSVTGYREHGLQFEGHVYLFADEGTLERFRSNPHYYADRAIQAMRSTSQPALVR